MGEVIFRSKELAIVAVGAVLILFLMYYFCAGRRYIEKLIRKIFPSSFSDESLGFFSEKFTGIIFTGIIPYILFVTIFNIRSSGFMLDTSGKTVIWFAVIFLVLLTGFTSFYLSKKPKIQERAPELRIKTWYPRHVILAAMGWLIYIFGYEFFFRGVLWFLCMEAYGFWPALGINLVLYAIVHLPKGKMMATGSVPMGVILCLVTYFSGSFHAAFLIHSVMAVVTEISSAWNNPAYQFRFNTLKK